MAKLKLKNIHLFGHGPEKALGELESKIMKSVWASEPATVRTVRDELARTYKDLSFNSVMTIMNRLVAKSLLQKKKRNGSFEYVSKVSQEQFSAALACDIISAVIKDPSLFSAASFAALSDSLDRESINKLKKFVSKL